MLTVFYGKSPAERPRRFAPGPDPQGQRRQRRRIPSSRRPELADMWARNGEPLPYGKPPGIGNLRPIIRPLIAAGNRILRLRQWPEIGQRLVRGQDSILDSEDHAGGRSGGRTQLARARSSL